MKKITLFILTIFTVATLFAAARPSLDGRAVVADSGTMPRGLFARTVGYLPGDSVTVTNPATGSTIDVLILGAIDPSEGVAILLSPEAADGLHIKPESNVQVKLTKRSGSLDENANGSAVISEENDTPAAIEETPAVAENPVEETPAVAESPAPVEEAAAVEEYPAVAEETPAEEAVPVDETPVIAEKTPEPEPVPAETEEVEETPVVAEETVEETVAEAKVVAKVEPVKEAPAEEEAELETVYEELPALPQDKKLQKVVVIEEKTPETEEVEEAAEPAVEEVAAVAEESPVEEEAVAEAKVDAEELPAGIEEEPVVVMNETPVEEECADVYQPIVLIPADSNPPVAEAEPVSEPVKEETPVAVKEEAPKVVVSNDWTNYVVPSIGNLRHGCYYVQVASLGNKENIKSFVEKYSTKYPVVLVQNSSKNTYQVMVGPLNIDEYGSVDEKFKAYGFKDAFIRKIR